MCSFKVGQMVVCIWGKEMWNAALGDMVNYKIPILKSVYTVSRLGPCCQFSMSFPNDKRIFIGLVGLPENQWFLWEGFRPVKETNIDVFTEILQNIPKTLEAARL